MEQGPHLVFLYFKKAFLSAPELATMQFASAVHVSEAWWAEACKKVKNAVVFVDNASAECLHWNGGLARLVDAGAKNVKEFSSFEVRSICMPVYK